ncbi:MAG: insulinase family protein [Hyphomicrobiales bacterium]
MSDGRVATPVLFRNYLTPSYVTTTAREANALRILAQILGGGSQSRFYQELVLKQRLANDATADLEGTQRLSGYLSVAATPTAGTSLEALEKSMDAIIADVAENGVLDDELQMAKDKTEAAMIFALDQPSAFGSLMGKAATFGLSPDATLHYIAAQKDVTAADVKAAAAKFLQGDHMVTGTLLPQQ